MGIAYNTSVVRSGLVLALDAANVKSYPGLGTVWTDMSGNGNNGTLVNGTGYSADNKGTLVFDGVNDHVNCGNVLSRNTVGQVLSINLWIYPTRSNNYIIGRGQSNANYGQYSLHMSGNSVLLSIFNLSAGQHRYTLGTVNMNTWSHIGWSHVFGDGTSTKSLINGISSGSWTQGNGNIVSDQGNTSLEIGHWFGTPQLTNDAYFFAGNIAQVSIYNRALTAAEIAQNFEATRGRYSI